MTMSVFGGLANRRLRDQLQCLAAGSLSVPVLESDGFACLSKGLIQQDGDGAFADAAFFREECDVHGDAG